jgi:hypothetical protein
MEVRNRSGRRRRVKRLSSSRFIHAVEERATLDNLHYSFGILFQGIEFPMLTMLPQQGLVPVRSQTFQLSARLFTASWETTSSAVSQVRDFLGGKQLQESQATTLDRLEYPSSRCQALN